MQEWSLIDVVDKNINRVLLVINNDTLDHTLEIVNSVV
jgi:hypothetical protein